MEKVCPILRGFRMVPVFAALLAGCLSNAEREVLADHRKFPDTLAVAGESFLGRPGIPFRFSGRAADGGRSWESFWSFAEAPDEWEVAPDGDVIHRIPSDWSGQYWAAFRIGDSSGFDTDTLWVWLEDGNPESIVYAGKDTVLLSGSTLVLEGTSSGIPGPGLNLFWDVGGTGNFQFADSGRLSVTLPDTTVGVWRCILKGAIPGVTDPKDTLMVRVIRPGNPLPYGMKTRIGVRWDGRTANSRESLELEAQAIEPGRILLWEWDIGGTGEFSRTPSGRVEFFLPIGPLTGFVCRVRGLNEYGVYDTSEVWIDIGGPDDELEIPGIRNRDGSMIPQVDAGPLDIDVFAGASMELIGEVEDPDSPPETLIRTWSLLGSGTWDTLPPNGSIRAEIPLEAIDQNMIWVFEVVDAEGNRSSDTLLARVHPPGWDWHGVLVSDMLQKRSWVSLAASDSGVYAVGGIVDGGGLSQNKWWGDQVYYSRDGFRWRTVTGSIPIGPRAMPGLAYFQNRLWLFGGGVDSLNPSETVWSSEDGMEWRVEAAEAPFGNQRGTSACVWKESLFVLAGTGMGSQLFIDPDQGTASGEVKGIWNSEDGVSWQAFAGTLPFHPSQESRLIGFQEHLYVFHPEGVWRTTDGLEWGKILEGPFKTPLTPVLLSGGLFLCEKNSFRYSLDGVKWVAVSLRERSAMEYEAGRFFRNNSLNPSVYSYRGKLFVTQWSNTHSPGDGTVFVSPYPVSSKGVRGPP